MINGTTNPFSCTPALYGTGNKIISLGTISRVVDTFTFSVGFSWLISNSVYQNATAVDISIAPATVGFKRIDIVILTKFNTIELIQGVESDSVVIQPVFDPEQTLLLTAIDIDGSTIATPPTPIAGDVFSKKIESSTHTFNGSGSLVSIPFQPSGATFVKLTNPSLTSISGFDFTLLTSGSEYPYEGKPIYLQNLTGNPVEIKHNDISNIEIPVLLKNEVPINIPDKEIILLRFKNVEVEEVLRSWAAAGSAAFGTLTGSPSDNAALTSVLNAKADKSDTYTKTEVDSKLSAVYIFKGNVANFAALPSSGQKVGWTYNVLDTGDNYAWDGSDWDKLSGVVDISGKEDNSNKKIDLEANKTSNTFYASCKAIADWCNLYFQAILVSGTNIKTINGNSILGSGNLVVGGSPVLSDTTMYSHTGTTAETLISTLPIPAGTITNNSIWEIEVVASRGLVDFEGNCTVWNYINNSINNFPSTVVSIGNTRQARMRSVKSILFKDGYAYYGYGSSMISDYTTQGYIAQTIPFDISVSTSILTKIQLSDATKKAYIDYVLFKKIN